MKNCKIFKKAFGLNAFELIDYPSKISNIKVSRLKNGNKMGCSRCFPHGFETINSTIVNRQRNWKKFRKTKHRSS